MKKVILIMAISFFGACQGTKPLPDTPIVYMEYIVQSMERYPSCHLILRMDEAGHYTLTNASGCAVEEAQSREVPSSFADSLKQIVAEEDMMAYQSEYKPLISVSDGNQWRLEIRFKDYDTAILSSGCNKQPKGNGLSRIKELCNR